MLSKIVYARVELRVLGAHSVLIPLYPAPALRIVWINRQVISDNPSFRAVGGNFERFSQHLLDSCVYITESGDFDSAAELERLKNVTGYADHYGGSERWKWAQGDGKRMHAKNHRADAVDLRGERSFAEGWGAYM